jgi:hypothetical protein
MKNMAMVLISAVALSACSGMQQKPSDAIDAYEKVEIWHRDQPMSQARLSMSPSSRALALANEKLSRDAGWRSVSGAAATGMFEKIGFATWRFEVENGSLKALFGSKAHIRFTLQPCKSDVSDPVPRCVETAGAPLIYEDILDVSIGHEVSFEFGDGYHAVLGIVGKRDAE